jgi:3-phenylpropionate/trans-cinnamate dioxygenase ferredoxin subunit/naphthalene 1,2-dioxygenase system ferredoxin subunit
MPEWHRVCSLAEVEEGNPLGVRVGEHAIGIFRAGERCFAINDVCTHEYALLSQGFQEGEIVECPLHAARFDLATGKCLSGPARRDIAVYEVRISDGEVLVRAGVPANK